MFRPKVKICGLKRPEDIQIINKYKPDFAGFVFAPGKRQITPEYAKSLINNLDSSILRAGIFVNEDVSVAAEIAVYCGLNAVQLHGDEDNEYIKKLRDLLYKKYNFKYNFTNSQQKNIPEIWKAIRVKNRDSFDYLHKCKADAFVLDTYSEKAYGGTGSAFDWEIAGGIGENGTRIILAGGLNSQNVRKAIDIVRPFAVDVSSGVETNGCKDDEKIRKFIFSIY